MKRKERKEGLKNHKSRNIFGLARYEKNLKYSTKIFAGKTNHKYFFNTRNFLVRILKKFEIFQFKV